MPWRDSKPRETQTPLARQPEGDSRADSLDSRVVVARPETGRATGRSLEGVPGPLPKRDPDLVSARLARRLGRGRDSRRPLETIPGTRPARARPERRPVPLLAEPGRPQRRR